MSEEIGELFNTITTIYINDRPVQAKLPSALQDSVIRKIDGKYYIEYGILDYIEHLQQKVEQLEKENKELKYLVDDSNIMKAFIVEHSKVEQLENIRKETIEYINNHQLVFRLSSKKQIENWFDEFYKDLLNILKKGE